MKKIMFKKYYLFFIILGVLFSFLVFNLETAQACTLSVGHWYSDSAVTDSAYAGNNITLKVNSSGSGCGPSSGFNFSFEIYRQDMDSEPSEANDSTVYRQRVPGNITVTKQTVGSGYEYSGNFLIPVSAWIGGETGPKDHNNLKFKAIFGSSFGWSAKLHLEPRPICGNGVCNADNGETTTTCPQDCPTPTPNPNCGALPLLPCPAGETTTYPFQVPNPLQGDAETVADLVGLIVKWLFSIAIPIAVAVIVYSGILFLTSKGDPAQVTKAKQFLTYAVIGLAIILVGSGFITLIRSILELSG